MVGFVGICIGNDEGRQAEDFGEDIVRQTATNGRV
jgi:hypothetical protein